MQLHTICDHLGEAFGEIGRIDCQSQTLPGVRIHHAQDPNPPSALHRIVHKIQRNQYKSSCNGAPFTGAGLAELRLRLRSDLISIEKNQEIKQRFRDRALPGLAFALTKPLGATRI